MENDKINNLNKFKRNLLEVLDNKNISQRDGNDKIKDYIRYLYDRTNISKYRLKKMFTYDVSNLITANDIDILAKVLEVSYEIFFRGDEIFEENNN